MDGLFDFFQGEIEIPVKLFIGDVDRGEARDDDVIVSGDRFDRQQSGANGAQTALRPVAANGVSDFFGRRVSDSENGRIEYAPRFRRLQYETGPHRFKPVSGDVQEVRSFLYQYQFVWHTRCIPRG